MGSPVHLPVRPGVHPSIANFFFITLLLLVTGLTASSATAQGQGAAGSDQIVTVQASHTAGSVTLGGSVVAYKQVTLTAQIPGQIDLIAGAEGDKFKKATSWLP